MYDEDFMIFMKDQLACAAMNLEKDNQIFSEQYSSPSILTYSNYSSKRKNKYFYSFTT